MKHWFVIIFITITMLFMAASTSTAHFTSGCKKNRCKRHVVKPFKPRLLSIASCESTRRWNINGLFDGGLQFHPNTWNATGSKYKYAYNAPELEQMYRGVIWAYMIGWRWHSNAGWPNCG